MTVHQVHLVHRCGDPASIVDEYHQGKHRCRGCIKISMHPDVNLFAITTARIVSLFNCKKPTLGMQSGTKQ